MQAPYTVDCRTPQSSWTMFATAWLHWRRADARAPSGSLGQAAARGAADPYALWPRRGAGSAFARDAAKKVAAPARIAIVGNFKATSECAAMRVALRCAQNVKAELVQKCPTSEATGLTRRSPRISIRNRYRSATPAGRSLPRCALATPPAIARWSRGLSSWPRAAERWFTAPALKRAARADCPGHRPAAGRKIGRIHAARSAQGPGSGFRPGCSGINRELRCPVT